MITDEKGEAQIDSLPIGSYQIREIASPDYVVFDPDSDPIVFEIKETDTEGHIETIENRPNTPDPSITAPTDDNLPAVNPPELGSPVYRWTHPIRVTPPARLIHPNRTARLIPSTRPSQATPQVRMTPPNRKRTPILRTPQPVITTPKGMLQKQPLKPRPTAARERSLPHRIHRIRAIRPIWSDGFPSFY